MLKSTLDARFEKERIILTEFVDIERKSNWNQLIEMDLLYSHNN